jgi:phage tail sheath protein FI
MPTYLNPGVYVEEITDTPPPVTGAATAITAFVDVFVQGPLQQAVQINSRAEFEVVFGVGNISPASQGIQPFFANGGQTAWVVRIPGRVASAAKVIGAASTQRGLHALDDVDLFNILCLPCAAALPDAALRAIYGVALEYCAARHAFLIIDIPAAVNSPAIMLDWLAQHDTLRHRNAAVYFPRVVTQPQLPGKRVRTVAVSGGIAGLYARTDAARGVWKASAGREATLQDMQDFAYALKADDCSLLSVAGVNALRRLETGELVCWGARTLLNNDMEWSYVPVRRLALYIEASLERGFAWAIFETNDEHLWQKARRVVDDFMLQLFRQGALAGATVDAAYFVRADRSTMTPNDIDNGRLIIMLGFAPIKPAEFIVLQIQVNCHTG